MMKLSLATLALGALFSPLFAAGCGDVFTATTGTGEAGGTSPAGGGGTGGTGAAGGAAGSGATGGVTTGSGGCPAASECSGQCVDLTHDKLNCGKCGQVCNAICTGGACDDPVDIAAGAASTCAVMAKGEVYCWGKNNVGQLNTGGDADSAVPIQVAGVPLAKRVFVGRSVDAEHLCAVAQNDDLYCWGSNESGKLGIGNKQVGPWPPKKVSLGPVKQVALGLRFSLATQGTKLYAWGDNLSQQLGYQGVDDPSPNATSQLSADAVCAGSYHGCRVSGENLSCWGRNTEGQVGSGNNDSPLYPTQVPFDGAKPVDVACGEGFSCARLSNGLIKCWGTNTSGQLALSGVSATNQPTTVADLAGATASVLAAGAEHTGAIANGSIWLWGRNAAGQVSSSGNAIIAVPKKQDGLANAVKLALGATHTCALLQTGLIFCWGGNSNGQLGNGTVGGDHIPAGRVKF